MSFPIHIVTVPSHIMLVGLLIKNKSSQFKTLPVRSKCFHSQALKLRWIEFSAFQKRMWRLFTCIIGYSWKKKTKNENMEFPGVLKSIWKFQGSSKRVEFSPNQKKIMWNFHGSWFLVLKFPRVVAQFCGISWGEALLSPEFPRIKWQT